MQSSRHGFSFDRRSFFKYLLLSAGYLLTSCAKLIPHPTPGDCGVETDNNTLYIDMHCHLINLWDLDENAFIERRVSQGNKLVTMIFDCLAVIISPINYLFAKTAPEESKWILAEMGNLQEDPQSFCDAAAKEQIAVIYPTSDTQTTGLFSNRTRNAARLIDIFPEVDIFTPSMVDFYEGRTTKYSYPTDLAIYYKRLNLASYGRFLPLVSFSPERWFREEAKENRKIKESFRRNMELVRQAIEEWGFIGVKLHPSSGFSPVNNETHGCPNTFLQWQKALTPEEAAYYDSILMELFLYCRSKDVPLLIHSGTGISPHRECMERGDNPAAWTNAPELWSRMLDQVNEKNMVYDGWRIPDDQKLKICLSHFAGAFCTSKSAEWKGDSCKDMKFGDPHPWLEQAGCYAKCHREIYVDLADVDEWFVDDLESFSIWKSIFVNFLDRYPELAQNIMYGTDWHLTSAEGHNYLPAVQEILPANLWDRTKGLNAVNFYGLAHGRPTRERLEIFYAENKIPSNNISWMAKVDRLYNDIEMQSGHSFLEECPALAASSEDTCDACTCGRHFY